jgi:hypothetical protein
MAFSRAATMSSPAWIALSIAAISRTLVEGTWLKMLRYHTFHKARLRTPANRADFAEMNVALVNDRWVHSPAGKSPERLAPMTAKFLDALINAAIGNEANKMYGHPAASFDLWQAECVKAGLLERERGKTALDHTSRSLFSKYKRELIAANRIACNDTMAWVLP